ncbi:MAG TPA: hypothetical protein VF451_07975, partial [Acidobacteriota bacterium]
MKNLRWQLILSAVLVLISLGFYTLHFLLFNDAHYIFEYLLGDIAFLPFQVLFVTLIINQLLGNREKKAKLKKMDMVIGTFFSEVGGELLKMLLHFEKNETGLKAL